MHASSPLLALLAVLTAAPIATLAAQAPKPPKPDGWIKSMEALEAELTAKLKQLRIDLARDDLPTIQEKQTAIAKAIEAFANESRALMLDRRDLAVDHARFIDATTPRLRGPVLSVGAGLDYADLTDALAEAQEGALILLGAGSHRLPDNRELRDILIVGHGREKTTLQGSLRNAWRVKISNLTIDCNNDECVYLRQGGFVQLEKCLIQNYNSGAGGSNAIFGVGSTIYLQDCEFEGDSGRLAGQNRFGDAMDLRDATYLLARGTLFRDNSEIVRAQGFCVFDQCRSISTGRSSGISTQPEGFLATRNIACPVRGTPYAYSFATDDRQIVQFLAGRKSKIAKETRTVLERLGLARSPRYWATLLQHPHKEVRFIAQGQLRGLLRSALPKFELDRKEVARLPKEMQQPFAEALRSSHALRWLDDHGARLIWNPGLKSYRLKD